jgi:hypothetical protein
MSHRFLASVEAATDRFRDAARQEGTYLKPAFNFISNFFSLQGVEMSSPKASA